ncbi:transcription factor TFIIIC subunit tfc4 [Podospora pseudopauciseta]|uniref:Transcription factor TFIIIC subunit tfc4 n=1 Tax=Podospora pseudopauciseta TaxID=2093780 RepID=A0ABR0H135_9PEZI|nr:transcription factor TFIIIC subunit tfc4 [Podospora pseudopauciseta]
MNTFSSGLGGIPMDMLDPSLFPEGHRPLPPAQQQDQDAEMGDCPAPGDDHLEDGGEESDVSDMSVDSDAMELAAEVARFDKQQEEFVARQRADAAGVPYQPPAKSAAAAGEKKTKGGVIIAKGRKRKSKTVKGPRQAVKPSPDILFRLNLAQQAFQRGDYEATMTMISEIIRINSEVIHAWVLLSSVHEALENRSQAVMCRITAAHLTPRDVPQWIATAEYCLEGVDEMDDDEEGNQTAEKIETLKRAYACYSQALEVDRTHIQARIARADVIMMMGNQQSRALGEYQKALGYRPYNIRTVRNIADVALDVKDLKKGAGIARAAYRKVINYLMERGTFEAEEGRFEWSDLRIYLEFFGTLELWREGLKELKEIARWLSGRREETYWEQFDDGPMGDDDREWDIGEERRFGVQGFVPGKFPRESYGLGMPMDLRAKMFVYRCKLGFQDTEARRHLELLDPTRQEEFMDFPDCLKDIAVALLDQNKAAEAKQYLDLFKHIAETEGTGSIDADFLVCQGRYHISLGEKQTAEECFIAAIEDDEDHIEARVQLANMYEGEQEQEGREEAFLLVHEALNLQKLGPRKRRGPYGPRKNTGPRKPRKPRDPNAPKSKYVPRRLLNAEKRRQQEIEQTKEATKNYQIMQEMEGNALLGDEEAKSKWMAAAKALVDDFRAYKQFYPWDKYIKFLGYVNPSEGGQQAVPARNLKLAAMEERLRQNLAPADGADPATAASVNKPHFKIPQEHRGIPFTEWLNIFLNYAFALVRAGQHREAYAVCHAARDSVVWTSIDNTFLIHVAWASCAVYAGDEETCVAIARYFMRDYRPGTDSYRMFSAMCRVCQTPVSWYTSGPAQKFILRQIKTMDNIVMRQQQSPSGEKDDSIGLDVSLLTIYGHILFTTTSYTYALSYFARAASIDPTNCLINLSTGLAYIHYALKRQATNRQYLLNQGFGFLFRYYEDRLAEAERNGSAGQRQEAHFNMARAYSLIGLGNVAVEFYKKVLEEPPVQKVDRSDEERWKGGLAEEDLRVEAAYNLRSMGYLLGDLEGAAGVVRKWMVLE